ncbi:MAG: hypothetical protein ACODUE_08180 [Synechococcus sp.]
MAFTQALLPAPREEEALLQWCDGRLLPALAQLDLVVEQFDDMPGLIFASDRPGQGLAPRAHVKLLCDWSSAKVSGDVLVEMRSGELMATRDTRCQRLMAQLLELMQAGGSPLEPVALRVRRPGRATAWPGLLGPAPHAGPAPALQPPHNYPR